MWAAAHPGAMTDPSEPPVDYESLAEFLKALSNPVRLELLDALRFPKMVGEIKVAPQRLAPGDNPDRPAARQTLQAHLDRLVAADLVREDAVKAGERSLRRYAVNSQRLYVVTEELRRLSTHHAGRGGEEGSTHDASGRTSQPAGRAKGPRLVLVHGVYEGKAFHLDPSTADATGGWTIGRKRGLPVSLDYDPYVSTENARVRRAGDAFEILDLPDSRNGTRVNWEPLASGIPRAMEAGDIIGVGRTLMVFVAK